MSTIKVLGICGSLRRASTNMGLMRYAQQHVPEGMSIEIADLADMPFYNADISDRAQREISARVREVETASRASNPSR